ncbi:MAG: hypothetical protein RLZZ414_12 [Bacteroidota bacterium]|jgi:hypothetical protein
MPLKSLQISLFLFVFFSLQTFFCKADHYMGGFFSYEYLQNDSFLIRLYTFTDTRGRDNDRDSVNINYGDNKYGFLKRINTPGEKLNPLTKINIYEGKYKYDKFGIYQLTFLDQFRLSNIRNMTRGMSTITHIYVTSILPYENPNTNCLNNSPVATAYPNLNFKTGETAKVNFGLWDKDGDSLSYQIVPMKARNGNTAPGYYTPSNASINAQTGDFTFSNMQRGDFGFAVLVKEYRAKKVIAETIYDFTIRVTDNHVTQSSFIVNNNQFNFLSNNSNSTFTVETQNTNADSVWIDFKGSIHQNNALQYTIDTIEWNKNKCKFNITVNYTNNNQFSAFQNLIIRTHFKIDTNLYFNDYPINFLVPHNLLSNCTVSDIEKVIEVQPIIDTFSPSKIIFSNEGFWLNAGENTDNISIDLYDIRGRLINRFENINPSVFKVEVNNLSAAIYILVIYRDQNLENATVQKLIKL